jgi:hypothetical protein
MDWQHYINEQVLNKLPEWLAGLGTLLAVVVALYLREKGQENSGKRIRDRLCLN